MKNKELYGFLMSSECHLYESRGIVRGFVCINFTDLIDFIDAVGTSTFDEYGLEVTMKNGYIAVDINLLLDGWGETILDCKEIFGNEWEEYFGVEIVRS